eukprot:13841311-Alexandrium_andersonii.AAC.1
MSLGTAVSVNHVRTPLQPPQPIAEPLERDLILSLRALGPAQIPLQPGVQVGRQDIQDAIPSVAAVGRQDMYGKI